VIVGCGFGGLYAARALRRAHVRITLLDRRNHHLFQPLLYQVATAGLTDADVAAPIRKLFRRRQDVTVLMGEVVHIDPERHLVRLEDGTELAYEYLIVATGTVHNYFGHAEWEALAPGLKSLEDAYEIRRRILLAFERAERVKAPEERRRLLTFVIVGAGPTGVELAGAIREIALRTLARDFRSFSPSEARVLLLEGADRVLPTFPPESSEQAAKLLEARGVELHLRTHVIDVRSDGVVIASGWIPAGTVLWAAGLRASPLVRATGAPLDRGGRACVAPDLSVPEHPEIFVIGDAAAVSTEGKGVPGVAPAAIQAGRFVAGAICRELRGEPRGEFAYHDRGSLATIGKRAAVLAWGRVRLAGTLAWLAWLVVHVAWLIGFRNRVAVLLEWTWAYITHQRSARIILGCSEHRKLGCLDPADTPAVRASRT
jgi:NADH dehydrogenase